MEKEVLQRMVIRFSEIINSKLSFFYPDNVEDIISFQNQLAEITDLEKESRIPLFPSNNCSNLVILFYLFIRDKLDSRNIQLVLYSHYVRGDLRFHMNLETGDYVFDPIQSNILRICEKKKGYKEGYEEMFRSSDMKEILSFLEKYNRQESRTKNIEYICSQKKPHFEKLVLDMTTS